jgi:hypothetical protein
LQAGPGASAADDVAEHRAERTTVSGTGAMGCSSCRGSGPKSVCPVAPSNSFPRLVKCRRDAEMTVSGLDAKFAVPATQVLHECMTANNHPRGRIGLQSAHRPQPRLIRRGSAVPICPRSTATKRPVRDAYRVAVPDEQMCRCRPARGRLRSRSRRPRQSSGQFPKSDPVAVAASPMAWLRLPLGYRAENRYFMGFSDRGRRGLVSRARSTRLRPGAGNIRGVGRSSPAWPASSRSCVG